MSTNSVRLVFRCDGGPEIGLGHVVSCLRLADLLKREADLDASFVVRDDPSVVALVLDSEFALDVIPMDTSPEEDFTRIVRMAAGREWRGVVTNFCKTDLDRYATHFSTLKGAGLKLIFMDHPIPPSCWLADVLINALPHPHYEDYDPRKHSGCYDGLEYLILDPALARMSVQRAYGCRVERVLVSMGGGDFGNTTKLVLQGLQASAFGGYVDVVLGAANPHERSVRSFFQSSGLAGEINRNCIDLPQRMMKADVGFSSLGMTTYEMAALGLPVLILASTPFNAHVAEIYVRQYQAGQAIGDARFISPATIANAVNDLSQDRERRQRLGEAGRRIGTESSSVSRAVARAVSSGTQA